MTRSGADPADPALGPRPTPAGPAIITAAQSEILERLRDHFVPVTARALAEEHGLHPNTVREHLEVLVSRGLASRTRLRAQGRGRPSYGYTATSALSDLQAHAALVDALSDHLATTADDPAGTAEQLGRRYAERLHLPAPVGSPDDDGAAFTALADYMGRLGFGPRLDPRTGVARLLTCPLLGAARRHEDVVCGFHRGMAQGLLERHLPAGAAITIDAFAEPGACLLSMIRTGARPAPAPTPAPPQTAPVNTDR